MFDWLDLGGYCLSCGISFEKGTKRCPKCGREMKDPEFPIQVVAMLLYALAAYVAVMITQWLWNY